MRMAMEMPWEVRGINIWREENQEWKEGTIIPCDKW